MLKESLSNDFSEQWAGTGILRTVGEVGPSHDPLIGLSATKSPFDIDHDSSDWKKKLANIVRTDLILFLYDFQILSILNTFNLVYKLVIIIKMHYYN